MGNHYGDITHYSIYYIKYMATKTGEIISATSLSPQCAMMANEMKQGK